MMSPALTLVLTFRLRAAVWLWLQFGSPPAIRLPAMMFVLTFIVHLLTLLLIEPASNAASSASMPALISVHLYRREREGKSITQRKNSG